METKRKIVIAAELLMNSFGYVHGEHGHVAYDFRIDDDGKAMSVFCVNDDAFYWVEKLSAIAEAVGLSCHVLVQGGSAKFRLH